jgi:hypothetical protein
MSATHKTSGAAGLKSRRTRFVGDPHARHADRGAAALSLHKARDPGFTHQPLDALAADFDPVREAQLGVDSPCAVDAARTGVDLLDLLGQPSVLERALAGRAMLEAMERGPVYAQHPRHQRDRM